jgi:Haloacid Dehalogenase superfamily, subfamily IB, phosphoserine phosphatase-like/2,3-diketo-5-methylthio-1-phosphopentane phosphatase
MMDREQHARPDFMENDWNIICDFDGTIARFDVTDAVLEAFADPAWETVEKEWLDGAITARQCMERQVRMITVPPARLDAFLATIPLTNGFAEFTRFCAANTLDMLVVSDGMDYAIKRILTGNGLANIPVIANRLRFHGDSEYRLDFPYGAEGCASGVCKCDVARTGDGKILLIGDGHSDICLANIASFVLAKKDKSLHRHCRENDIPHAVYDDFFDILRFFTTVPHVGYAWEAKKQAAAL